MVKRYTEPLDLTFFALADPTRRAILARLAQGEAAVSELAEPLSMTLAAVTKHLALLESASLIAREKAGRVVTCRLSAKPMQEAAEWIAHYAAFWDEQLAALSAHLAQGHATTEENPCPQPSSSRSGARPVSRPRAKRSSTRGRARKN